MSAVKDSKKAPPVEIVPHPNPETCRGHRSAVQLLGCFKAVLAGNFLMIKKSLTPPKLLLTLNVPFSPRCHKYCRVGTLLTWLSLLVFY